jgi:L-threonylcarbamoyladenylate synthase
LLLPPSEAASKRVMGSYPRPITWVLPCLPEIPVWLRGAHQSLAVRITHHLIAGALCQALGGPLVSTSANRHGGHPATTPLEVHRIFGNRLDYIVHGPVGADARPSEIRDGISGRVLRA